MLRPRPFKKLPRLLSPKLPRTLRASFALTIPPMLGAIDTGKVLRLVDKGVDHDWTDKRGWTLLMIAIETMQPDVVKKLIDSGAHIDRAITEEGDNQGMTPVHIAVAKGNRFSLAHLLAAQAKVNVPDALGQTPLHYAVRQDADKTQMLIKAGAVIDARCKKGATPLMFAASRQPAAAVAEALLNAGADPSLAEYSAGKTVLDHAAINAWAEKPKIESLIAGKIRANAMAREKQLRQEVKNAVAQVATAKRDVKIFRRPIRFK